MITIPTTKIKSFTQKNYDELINTLPFHKVSCTCGQLGKLIKHGYYIRSIKTPDGLVKLKILRVKCKSCKRTHAILLDFIVPYSQILLKDHISIIQVFEKQLSFESIMLSNLLIDEGNLRYIIKQYLHHWKEKLLAYKKVFNASVSEHCFTIFKRQFMQIKQVPNILFIQPT
ncbi:MAG: DUF6431 domain-containing protein [Vulcanibacillus sp.]